MISVKSVPFSFIRFEDLSDAYCAGDARYVLPAGTVHEAKFQFIVDGDDLPEGAIITVGINGVPMIAPSVDTGIAQKTNYKHRLELDFYDPDQTIWFESFKLGDEEVEYNKFVTWPQLLELLKKDFGLDAWIVTGDTDYLYFINACKLTVELKAGLPPDNSILTMNTVSYLWHQAYMKVPSIPITDNCFQYTLHAGGDMSPIDGIIGASNVFERKDICFTSLLTYSCLENAFDFHYVFGEVNQVRLPFYLSRPQHPVRKTVYVKSNGRQVLLAANVEKEYLLNTDWMIELFHECMAIALQHDSVIINNENIREKTVEVIHSEYSPEWNNDFELIEAPAKGRIKVATFGKSNDNCGAEEENCGIVSASCPLITGLAIGSITANSAIASWTAAGSPAVKYEINLFRADTPGTPVAGYPKILPVGITAHQFTGLESATDYQFQVRSICNGTVSNWVELVADPDFRTL